MSRLVIMPAVALLLALVALSSHGGVVTPAAAATTKLSASSSRNAAAARAAGLGKAPVGNSCGTKSKSSELGKLEAAGHLKPPPEMASERTAATTIYIRVYWHIVTDQDCSRVPCYGYLTDALVRRSIAILNKSYAGGYAGSKKVNTRFKFSLKGITRTVNPNYFYSTVQSASDVEMRAVLRHKPSNRRELNIFSTYGDSISRADGWASFPWWTTSASGQAYDGVTVSYLTVPGSANNYPYGISTQGKVLTHEVGHWLGLSHTFEGGCTITGGDFVTDTVPEAQPARGCPTFLRTCKGSALVKRYGKNYQDPYNNFMDYSSGRCLKVFTKGQATRMRSAWRRYRA
mmetsp:Transcript_14151/g.42717  ORF Transcript_14151/g.42717 Transcript_14151/m.42717 type:complete len:345 (-) Transcript_14151:597-1631(-)|eukprot:CAMPEP_0206146232 /NCGR_PEP_ID=MMETSP1473-20131121/29771_1 /ASSEMBLY_ACC=CAM_ASM_001109 /TAXON_ID=1461547 /ORGANISM="Stichococcus sp, Strain RCC1054" /LENGTH=344 /DNA_ID=CAMNT_0053542713 /DNA_START=224 /DNA_END=1258 /DNA_ORIENTATION=-